VRNKRYWVSSGGLFLEHHMAQPPCLKKSDNLKSCTWEPQPKSLRVLPSLAAALKTSSLKGSSVSQIQWEHSRGVAESWPEARGL
jgi:hypothetical protein